MTTVIKILLKDYLYFCVEAMASSPWPDAYLPRSATTRHSDADCKNCV